MAEHADAPERVSPSRLLLDLSAIDLTGVHATKAQVESIIPHRGAMSLLDEVIWAKDDFTEGVARHRVRPDEFWVPGHFPGKPMLPGVIMIETAAQLGCYLFIVRKDTRSMVAFLRIEHASFRNPVTVGDDFLVLAKEVRVQKRRFVSDVQGAVGDKVCFDARISGIIMEERKY